MQHVMVDMETLDTGADAVILSIGAVKFDLDSERIDDEAFYASISIDSNLDAKRRISESTLLWWMKQTAEAQAVFSEPKQALKPALEDFCAWWGASQRSKFIWSNGASFDISMMANAMRSFKIETPWEFYDERCMRTYKNLPGMKTITVKNPLKHNAMTDALTQAKLLQAIHKKLVMSNPHPMVKTG